MIRRRIACAAAATALAFLASVGPALGQAQAPGANLGGYDGIASSLAVSFQPFLPAFVSTGDVPFEATIAHTSSRTRSGGISFGRAAFVWPGSTAADLGPVLGAGFGEDELGALVPKWPLQAQATQDDGEVTTGLPPALVMRAVGALDRGEGDARIADVEIPGLLHIEHVASTASSVVTDSGINAVARVTLSGVSLFGGYITAEQIRSVSRTTSIGGAASSGGDVDIIGLAVGGVQVSVTDDGFQVIGLPPDAEGMPGSGDRPFPDASPEETVNQILDLLGARITLFESISATTEGKAERMQPGVVFSIENPLGGQGPIPPGRFDIFLASTSASAFGSLPFSEAPGVDPPEAPAAAGGSTMSIGGGPEIDGTVVAGVGERLAQAAEVTDVPFGAPGGFTGALPQRGDYSFGGIPAGLIVVLVLAAAVAARYVRRFLDSMIAGRPPGEG